MEEPQAWEKEMPSYEEFDLQPHFYIESGRNDGEYKEWVCKFCVSATRMTVEAPDNDPMENGWCPEATKHHRVHRPGSVVTEVQHHNFRVSMDHLIRELKREKEQAYHERNLLVALLASMDPGNFCLGVHEGDDWDDDWRNVVFTKLHFDNQNPSEYKQISYHIHDSELPLFWGLKKNRQGKWDGHTTPEKETRIQQFIEDQHQIYRRRVVYNNRPSEHSAACHKCLKFKDLDRIWPEKYGNVDFPKENRGICFDCIPMECDRCERTGKDVEMTTDPYMKAMHDEEEEIILCGECFTTRLEAV